MKVAMRPFFILLAFVLLVGLACGLPASGDSTDDPSTQPVVEQPTQAPEPTNAPTEEPPTATQEEAPPTFTPEPVSSGPEPYFLEEFGDDVDLNNYSYFEWHGEDAGYDIYAEDDMFVFDIQSADRWVYVTYDAYTYDDVIIEIVADNRGMNNNNVSLICRYDYDADTWYEFNIANNGLYWIFAYDGNDYQLIYNGGSNAIKQGKDVNVYTAGCIGDTLYLYINNVEARTVTDTRYKLREGQVGFSVSSFDVTPILVEIDSFGVYEP